MILLCGNWLKKGAQNGVCPVLGVQFENACVESTNFGGQPVLPACYQNVTFG